MLALKESKTVWFYYFALCALVFFAVLFTSDSEIPKENVVLAIFLFLYGLFPVFSYYSKGKVVDEIPLLPLHGVFYSVTFAFPIVFVDLTWWDVPNYIITEALLLSVVGLTLLYFCYYIIGGQFFKNTSRITVVTRITKKSMENIGWVFLALHFIYLLFPAVQKQPSISHFLVSIGWVGIGVLYYMCLKGLCTKKSKALFYFFVIPILVVLKFSTGALAQLFLFFLFLLLLRWWVLGRVPWKLVLVIVFSFIILNPVKYEFRAVTWYANKNDFSITQKAILFVELITKHYTGDKQATQWDSVLTRVDRINHIGTFSYVINATPQSIPYWKGETYSYLLVSFIPRLFWPDKPTAPQGNEFGQRYGLLAPFDDITTFNLPWLPEFYANFGIVGVLLGMSIVGLLFRFIVEKFRNNHSKPIEYIIGLAVSFSLFYAESNLALMLGGVITTFITLYISVYIATRKYRFT